MTNCTTPSARANQAINTMTVATVSPASVTELDTPEIASINGGGVAVRKSPAGKLVPDAAVYKVRLVPRQMMPTRWRPCIPTPPYRAPHGETSIGK